MWNHKHDIWIGGGDEGSRAGLPIGPAEATNEVGHAHPRGLRGGRGLCRVNGVEWRPATATDGPVAQNKVLRGH
jgi:hypothetical protein